MGSDERNGKYLSPSTTPLVSLAAVLWMSHNAPGSVAWHPKTGCEEDYYSSNFQKNRSLVKITNVTMRGVGGFRWAGSKQSGWRKCDVNCQNWPIIGHARSRIAMFKTMFTGSTSLSLPNPNAIFSFRSPYYLGAWKRQIRSHNSPRDLLIPKSHGYKTGYKPGGG